MRVLVLVGVRPVCSTQSPLDRVATRTSTRPPPCPTSAPCPYRTPFGRQHSSELVAFCCQGGHRSTPGGLTLFDAANRETPGCCNKGSLLRSGLTMTHQG